MTSIRFLHASDLQLGMKRHFLDPEAHARFDAARIETIHALGRVARQHDCQFIVIAGDIFEYNSVSAQTLGRAAEAFRSMRVPTYLLPGNHDPLVADSILKRLVELPGMEHLHLLSDTAPRPFDAGAVEVIGAPLLARHANRDLVAEATHGLEPTSIIRVVVGHGQVNSYGSSAADLIELPPLDALLNAGAIDYVALGDTHSTASLSPTGKVWFSGAPETTDFAEEGGGGEADSGNALVVEITKQAAEAAQVEVKKVAVGQWEFLALQQEVHSAADAAAFLQRLDELPHKERTVVKYALSGTVGVETMRQLEEETHRLEPVFAALYKRERLMNLQVAPTADELADLGLRGFAAATLSELLEAGETDAVNLLFHLSSTSSSMSPTK